MTPFERRVQAAVGWLELGLPLEADEELEGIEPGLHTRSECLAVRVIIYQKLARWERMEIIAKQLCQRQPDNAQWPILRAYATRRAFNLESASIVLMEALARFPREATIHYNLACYAAQLGDLDLARSRLAEAIRMDPSYRRIALDDPDLMALHDEPGHQP